MENINEINIKNQTYFFFNDMINIKNFNPKLLKIGKKLYKNIDIYCIGYITVKDHLKIHSVNPLYLIIGEVDGYIEEKNGNKYLIFASTDKKPLRKYIELWNGIKNLIETINDKSDEYEKDFMKIKFISDVNLPLNKILKLHNLTTVVRSVFQENKKYYLQFF